MTEQALSKFLASRRPQVVVAKATPSEPVTSLATMTPETASRTTSYRIGIFPFGGGYSTLEQHVALDLQTSIKENPALALAYSVYDSALNEPRIKNPDRLWVGGAFKKEPNVEVVSRLARERGLDGVLMCWLKRTGHYDAISRPMDIYIIDVERRRVDLEKTTTKKSDVSKLIIEVDTSGVLYIASPPVGIKLKTVKPKPAVIQKKVHAGDTVVIGTKDGKEFRLRVTQITDTGVAAIVLAADTRVDFDASEGSEAVVGKGSWSADEEIEIPFDQIATIEGEMVWRMDGFGWGAGSILVPWTRTGLTASVSHFLQAGCHLYLNFFAWNSGTHHNDGFSRETTNYHAGCAHGLGVSDRGRGVCGPFSFRTALIV